MAGPLRMGLDVCENTGQDSSRGDVNGGPAAAPAEVGGFALGRTW